MKFSFKKWKYGLPFFHCLENGDTGKIRLTNIAIISGVIFNLYIQLLLNRLSTSFNLQTSHGLAKDPLLARDNLLFAVVDRKAGGDSILPNPSKNSQRLQQEIEHLKVESELR